MATVRPSPDVAFALDVRNQSLHIGDDRVCLTPRSFALLQYLIDNRGQLVTKQDLLKAVWHDVVVTPGQVKQFVAQLRSLLRDSPDEPRFIETIHGRGYRFVGEISVLQTPGATESHAAASGGTTTALFERDAQLREMLARLDAARQVRAGLCLVRGSWGSGKTALISEFLRLSHGGRPLLTLRSLCTDTYGRREPYFPLLDALDGIYGQPQAVELTDAIRAHAPRWHERLPGAGPAAGTSPTSAAAESMLREGLHLFEHLARDRALILCIDDIHHADVATVELLRRLLGRDRPAALLVVLGCGPTEASPARRSLEALVDSVRAHDARAEILLPPLSANGVARVFATRAPNAPAQAASDCFERTHGHPLLSALIADHMATTSEDGVTEPALWRDAIRGAVWHRLEGFNADDVRLIEAGSTLGRYFSASSVAGMLDISTDVVELRLAALARAGGFLRMSRPAADPDSFVAGTYEFTHGIVRDVVRERVTASFLQTDHARPAAFRESPGGDPVSNESWRIALGRHATETPFRGTANGPSGSPRRTTAATLAPEPTPRAGRRASDTAYAQTMRPVAASASTWGGFLDQLWQGELQRVVERSTRALRQPSTRSGLTAASIRSILGSALFHIGDLPGAERYLCCAPNFTTNESYGYGQESWHFRHAFHWSHAALVSWGRGGESDALSFSESAAQAAAGDPAALVLAWTYQAKLHQFRGDPESAAVAADCALKLLRGPAPQPMMESTCRILAGWARIELGNGTAALEEMEAAWRLYRSTGTRIGQPWMLSVIARGLLLNGELQRALTTVREGLRQVVVTGERVAACDLHCQEAELLAELHGAAAHDEIVASLNTALDIARSAHSPTWERAASRGLRRWLGARSHENGAAYIPAESGDGSSLPA